jgi:H+/Cl- antiporter ClcA
LIFDLLKRTPENGDMRDCELGSQDARGQTQANIDASLEWLTPRCWLMSVATGVAAGAAAIVMMAILRTVQHWAFSYHTGPYSTAAAAHDGLRRMLVVTGGGVVAGIGWWLVRRYLKGTGGSPTQAAWTGRGDLSVPATLANGGLSEVVIGLGASLGREAAPQHAGAAFGSWIARRFALPARQRTLLIACGAGAGVGAVYNVPFAGALFAVEVYLGSVSLATVAPALLTSTIATVVARMVLPTGPVYGIPRLGAASPSLLLWAVLAGPLIGIAGAGFVRLVGWASDHRPTGGRALLLQPPVAFAILGLTSTTFPMLLGNGRDLAEFALTGGGALATLAALAALKPLMTALCLRSGASGGLFTPTLSLGAVLGALLGQLWSLAWAGPSATSYALVGAGAMLAAGMQAPLAAIAFTIELTDTVNASAVAILLAISGALVVARAVGSQSIYSARLPPPSTARAGQRRPHTHRSADGRALRHPAQETTAPQQPAAGSTATPAPGTR